MVGAVLVCRCAAYYAMYGRYSIHAHMYFVCDGRGARAVCDFRLAVCARVPRAVAVPRGVAAPRAGAICEIAMHVCFYRQI